MKRLRKREIHVHREVLEVAEQLAHELFDSIMTRQPQVWDAFKARFPGRTTKQLERLFVHHHAPRCIPVARATMAAMLHPGVSPMLDDQAKERIMDVLVQDAQLTRGRVNPILLGN